ncbi:MAG TPA: VWA domain-containing protein [Candidatus Goldiibacteriota bacterium]|nr:VWA domain-containing protein [Candidatus Goldiibacteriota bacterium]
MRLANEALLPQLAVIAAAFIIYIILRHALRPKINVSNAENLKKHSSAGGAMPLVLEIVKAAGVLLLCVALLRPQEIKKETEENIKGIDIMLALDVSGSMQADDLKPNRLEAAKEVLGQFVSGLAGDRAGLVVFAGTSFSQCPLTVDYEIVKNFIRQVDFNTVRIDGTAVGDAIITAVNRLEKSGPTKVLILATDGVSNRGVNPVEAAQIAAYKGIKIYTIGIGKKGGSPMYQMGYDGVKRQVINRYTGQPAYWEEPDEDTLRQMAASTGGEYFRATDNRALKQIYDNIAKMEKQDIKVKSYNRHIDKFKRFLWAGALLVLLAFAAETVKYLRVIS